MSALPLDQLSVGQSAQISEIQGSELLVRRLRELGFFEGARVQVRSKGWFSGPVVIERGNLSIALRRSEASALKVTPA